MRNRDSKGPAKRAERSVETAGKRPYHRVAKSVKSQQKGIVRPAGKMSSVPKGTGWKEGI